MKLFFLRLRGSWRLLFGNCPSCNHDAPAVDTCWCCRSWNSLNRPKWPPPNSEIRIWRGRWERYLTTLR